MPGRTQVQRVLDEGASPAIAAWVGRIERHVPAVAPAAGFWASVYARFARHRGSVLAGGLAFFGLLSLVPAFISLGALVALFYDPAQFASDVQALITDRPEALHALGPTLEGIAQLTGTSQGTFGTAGLVSLVVALYAASRFVYVGRQVLDIAFELVPQPPSLLSRGIAILITLITQLVIVVGVIALTLVPRLLELVGIGESYGSLIRSLRLPVALVVVYLMITAAIRFGTHARGAVGWVNVGAALGTVLILFGTYGLGWYLGVSTTYSQIVAVLGGVIALELWLYVIGLAIVLSAEIEGVRLGFRRRDFEQP